MPSVPLTPKNNRVFLKNIILDFGGVLIDWNPHYLLDDYFQSREKASWFIANICTAEWNGEMDKGKPFEQGIAELSARYPEWAREIRLYYTGWIRMIGDEIPGMYQLECDLKAAGYRLFGLTNWSTETFCQVSGKRIFTILDGMVVSGEERLLKPDPAIYRILLDRWNLVPEECLFVDDNQVNVEGAQAVGIPALRFSGAEDLRQHIFTNAIV